MKPIKLVRILPHFWYRDQMTTTTISRHETEEEAREAAKRQGDKRGLHIVRETDKT